MKFEEKGQLLTIALDERIDSSNAHAVEEEIFASLPESVKTVQMDAANLKYISSVGLRVLLKLRKTPGKELVVFDVSKDVYDIFEMTGFTELMEIKKALRELSVEGCEVIGAGGYGTVYRLDSDTILKVYRPGIGEDFIDGERAASKAAFLLGIPTAIPYDTVKVGDQFGVVYEMVEARTVAQLIDQDNSCLPALGALSAKVLKQLHEIAPAPGIFPRYKQKYEDMIEKISVYITPEEKKMLTGFLDSIPERNTFIHGDYNPKNIMIKDGEIILIDIGAGSVGHPVFDLAGLMLAYLQLPKSKSGPAAARQLLGFDLNLAKDMWDVMITTYLDTRDAAELERICGMLRPVMLMNIIYQAFTRGNATEEKIQWVVNTLIRDQFVKAMEKAQPISF